MLFSLAKEDNRVDDEVDRNVFKNPSLYKLVSVS